MPPSDLPSEFAWSWFTEGNETEWASIEVSVGEFDSAKEALEYFRREYLPHLVELKRRLLFVRDVNGEAVGTIASWWNYTGERRDPSIHWLAVRKECQGLGLGKALIFESLRNLISLEGDKDIWIHTQTWSHQAIGLYLKAGFELVKNESFDHYANEYEQAIPLLRQKLPTLVK